MITSKNMIQTHKTQMQMQHFVLLDNFHDGMFINHRNHKSLCQLLRHHHCHCPRRHDHHPSHHDHQGHHQKFQPHPQTVEPSSSPQQRVISQSRTFEWFLIQACHPCSLIKLSSLSVISGIIIDADFCLANTFILKST